MRYFVFFSYNGTSYHGWQYQPNASSVQECMESAFRTLLRQPVTLTAAGRTDTGVHARLMTAHFDLPDSHFPFSIFNFQFKLNGLLPSDISVERIVPVVPTAHARFDAISRTYEYWVTDVKNPFTHFMHPYGDHENPLVFGESEDPKHFNASVGGSPRARVPNAHVFTIEADRFLRNMVRAVVGTLFEVGRGAMTIEQMQQAIRAHDRCAAGQSMPPDGLYLTDIRYPESIFL